MLFFAILHRIVVYSFEEGLYQIARLSEFRADWLGKTVILAWHIHQCLTTSCLDVGDFKVVPAACARGINVRFFLISRMYTIFSVLEPSFLRLWIFLVVLIYVIWLSLRNLLRPSGQYLYHSKLGWNSKPVGQTETSRAIEEPLVRHLICAEISSIHQKGNMGLFALSFGSLCDTTIAIPPFKLPVYLSRSIALTLYFRDLRL